ncbi:MAG: hypothetical protein AB7O45_12115 [Alphaproteobacteria bacterium]
MKKLLMAALLVLPAIPAGAVTFNVKNCWLDSVHVYTYNSNDTVHLVPFGSSGTLILKGSTAGVSCATDACKVRVTFHDYVVPGWSNYTYASDRCVASDLGPELGTISSCHC